MVEIIREGRIAELRKSQKFYRCAHCGDIIERKSQYYSVVIAGGGLEALKYPSRVHAACLEPYLDSIRDKRVAIDNELRAGRVRVEQKQSPGVE